MGVVYVLFAILGISILVVIHESGHYLVARACGMRVLRYSIGFGPAIFRYKPKGSPTTFQVCAVPFLAYVQIAGMNPQEDVDPDDPAIYPNKSLFARIATIAAGPVANYLAASVLTFGLVLYSWPEVVPMEPMTVGHLEQGSPAARADIREGDVVVEAHGKTISNVEDLIEVTSPRAGKPTVYVIERNGAQLPPLTIVPRKAEGGRGIIGVAAKGRPRYLPDQALEAAVVFPLEFTAAQITGISKMISQGTTEGLTGPVGMAHLVGESASRGPSYFAFILILLSVALGFFNLLPFPALDGGRLMFLGYELVTRRRPNERFEALVHTVGILILLGVLVLVTFRDSARLFGG